jgi:hypothetical protein
MGAKTAVIGLERIEPNVAESGRPQAQPTTTPSPDEIRQRAFELHLESGGSHGRDLDDWLQAERELKEKWQAG